MQTDTTPRHRRGTTLMALMLAFITLAAAASHAWAADDRREHIEFDSFTPKNMFELARERHQNWVPQRVWGDLSLPEQADKPVPAMVLMHGSGGIEASMKTWVDALNGIGVATFVVSTFEPRGVQRTVEDQNLVPPAANLMDALKALERLAKDPRIDPARVGVMGFSRGGDVAFESAEEPLRRAVLKSDLRFALHISLYGGCHLVYWSPQLTSSPMLNLMGDADDYTGTQACGQLAEQYAAAGVPIRTIRYAGANHSWDGVYPVHFLPHGTSSRECGVVHWDIATWAVRSELTGKTMTPPQTLEFLNACTVRGVHVGRNNAAAVQSRSDVLEFSRQVFFNAH